VLCAPGRPLDARGRLHSPGDDYRGRLDVPTLGECRIIIHQYHQVRAMIIGALSQLRVEQGGTAMVTTRCLSSCFRPVRGSVHQVTSDAAGRWTDSDDSVDGFLVYALAEHAWRCFGWSSCEAHPGRHICTICQRVSALLMIADPAPFVSTCQPL
jgi:hypothetical protein